MLSMLASMISRGYGVAEDEVLDLEELPFGH